MSTANRCTVGRAKTRGRDRSRRDEACGHGSNAAGVEADCGARISACRTKRSRKQKSTVSIQGKAHIPLGKRNFNTYRISCRDSRQQFGVFLPWFDDPKSLECVKEIEEMLAMDCRERKHGLEFRLTFG